MLLKILGALAIAYGAANVLLGNIWKIDIGTYLTIGDRDYTGMAAIIVGAVLWAVGSKDAGGEDDAA